MERRYSGTSPLARKSIGETNQDVIGENETRLAMCAYFPVVCLLPYLIDDGKTAFLTEHTKWGVKLFLTEILAGAVFFLPVFGPPLSCTFLALALGFSIWGLICVYRVAINVKG